MLKALMATLIAVPAIANDQPSGDTTDWQNWSWSSPPGDPPETYMGLNVQETTEQLRKALGVTDGNGALVVEIMDGSPAAAAGLRAGDVVVQVRGQKVNAATIVDAIRDRKAGDEVVIDYIRDRARKQAKLKLAKRPQKAGRAGPGARGGGGGPGLQFPTPSGRERFDQLITPHRLEQRMKNLEERLRMLEEKIEKNRPKT